MEPRCCWHREQFTPEECRSPRAHDSALRENRRQYFLHACLECHQFIEDLCNPALDLEPLRPLFPLVVEETLQLRAEVRTLRQLIGHLEQQGGFLREVGLLLQSSLDREEVIAMALTAITAGEGFGLNRAILLLVDHENCVLYGHLAVGPRDSSDAGRIWGEIHQRDFSLRDMAQRLTGPGGETERSKFSDLLAKFRTPLNLEGHLFNKVLAGKSSRHVRSLSNEPSLPAEQAEALGVEELLLVPLVSGDRRVGLLLADNLITRRPLGPADLQALETFAAPVAFAIERAGLHARLQQELRRTSEAHRQLQQQQEQLVKMEKHAVVGELSADLAHAIRNPLTILGAHARRLARQAPADSEQRSSLEGIMRESRRLEIALRDVLTLIDQRHPNLDRWDLNRILTQVYAGLQEDLELDHLDCHLDLLPGLPQLWVDYRTLGSCLQSIFRQVLAVLDRHTRLTVRSHQEGEQLVLTFTAPGLERLLNGNNHSGRSDFALTLCARALETQRASLETDHLHATPPELVIRFSPSQERPHGTPADR